MQNLPQYKNMSGFTLVELAVVMIIIGLLVGGVLKGQELIKNARIIDTVKQVEGYGVAHYNFFDIYRGYAGDLINARDRVKGCTAENLCLNGNGNSVIGGKMNGMSSYNSSLDRTENIQFWKHLALADLIVGVDPGADTAWGNLEFGKSHPAASVGGGFNVGHFFPTSFEQARGVRFVLAGRPSTPQPLIQPSVAEAIDIKMDDGKPNTGIVTAEPTGGGDVCDIDSTNSYLSDSEGQFCVLFISVSSN